MIGIVGQVALKAVISIGLKLMNEKVMEDLFVWLAEKLAGMTETKVDDELVAKIKGHLAHAPKTEAV